jgi:hypothetical protein
MPDKAAVVRLFGMVESQIGVAPDGFRAVPGHDGGSPHRGDWLDEVTIAARWFGHDGAYPSYDFINGLGRRRISHQNGEFITTQTEYETRRGSFG